MLVSRFDDFRFRRIQLFVMCASSKDLSSFQGSGRAPFFSRRMLHCLSLLALGANSIYSQTAAGTPQGVAWQVRGTWREGGNGAPIRTGDAIQPGSLLQPGRDSASHSITVLLADGQRFLYECFTTEDCARGFRVPLLNSAPKPFAVDFLERIRAELVRENSGSSEAGVHKEPALPRDEALVVLGPDGRIEVAGLAARLPNGRYSYDLRPLDRSQPSRFHVAIEKSKPAITLAVPSPGLYIATIADELNRPRIDLFIAAVNPAQSDGLTKSFIASKALIREWNESYGWPTHDVLWAYLESLLREANSPGNANEAREIDSDVAAPAEMAAERNQPSESVPTPRMTAEDDRASAVTAEPRFFPKPGTMDGVTTIRLQCDTPGAIVHYTLDGSQPVASSPVYVAPIVLKGGGMTVKSFAGAAGKKDSAVVTGNFRTEHESQQSQR